MPLSVSIMPELGMAAPTFRLTDVVANRAISLETFESKQALLVMFIACHCPFTRYVLPEIARIGRDYSQQAVGLVGICASDQVRHPEDGPAGLLRMAERNGLNFPVCFDETQQVTKAFMAACTPDFFLFDRDRRLAYRGRLDDTRPESPTPPTGKYLRQAIDAVLAGLPVGAEQQPSMGCNIKWKFGNEPVYHR